MVRARAAEVRECELLTIRKVAGAISVAIQAGCSSKTAGAIGEQNLKKLEIANVIKTATQAAIRAGYSPKTDRQAGTENLSKPVIAAAVEGGREP